MKQGQAWPMASRGTPLATQIRGSEKKSLAGAWLALLPLLLFGWFILARAHQPFFMKPGIPNPFVVVIGLIILVMLARAVWETIRLRRFGDPVLDLLQVPVPLGGTVEGRIHLGATLTAPPAFGVQLQCIRRVLQQSGKNSRWVETVLWAAEKTVVLLPDGIIPISLSVPPDQEETNASDAFNQILWRLTVKAPFRGPDFLEKYEIPVEGRTSAALKIAEEKKLSGEPQPVTGKKLFAATLPFLIVGLAVLAGGFYLLSLGVGDLRKASASAGWPTVPGQIRNSVAPRGNAIFVSDLNFAYVFAVNGTTYTGHTLYPHILWRQSAAREMVGSYPPGSPVTVHYSPADPANSCLVPGLRAGAGQRLVMGLLVVTFGLLFAASAAFAPRDAVMTGNSMTFRKGTTGSKVFGYSFLALAMWAVVLWWVS